MQALIRNLAIVAVAAPLLGALITGLTVRRISRKAASTVTITFVAIAFCISLYLFKLIVLDGAPIFNGTIYTWGTSGSFEFNVGFLIDRLTVTMMVIVTFVSLLVHIYSIGYMADDKSFQRFFCYMSLFTFAMLTLVAANNFLLLFFGWEGVGLVSYLLIGFWFKKESAAQGSLKAFLVNRAGDFGFILGIAAVLDYVGSLNYGTVFAGAANLTNSTITIIPGHPWPILTVVCILLFIGAMGKSAQVPLHIWLPESMEGPTPISALIHAATMVTAGVYMVARMSPLFEYSSVALNVVLVIGASGALFLGILGIVANDIKRVIAYSTMSQLGYMMAATGASAFSAGIFHLLTHACFKALLFLAAGSVIIALHHEQDLRKMGGLRRYMPITYVCFLVGALALAAIPPFSGFYSKDAIIDAVRISTLSTAGYAYVCLVLGAFVTGVYIFRAFFLAFHGKERTDIHIKGHIKESRPVVTVPLIILAIASTVIGAILAGPMLYQPGDNLLGDSVMTFAKYNVLRELAAHYHGPLLAVLDAYKSIPFWFAAAGIVLVWICYILVPSLPGKIARGFKWIYFILVQKYGFDAFNDLVFVQGGRRLSNLFYKVADIKVLDNFFVNGSGRSVNRLSLLVKKVQSGYLYHYVFAMIIGLVVFLCWLVF